MFKVGQVAIFFALLLVLSLSNQHLNIKYKDFIDGKGYFDLSIVQSIYDQYRSPYNEKSPYRLQIFLETLMNIREHNSGDHTWKQGINDFSDMTFQEFSESRLMEPQQKCSATNKLRVSEESKVQDIPTDYEWNSYGMVTPVKNQGSCGSCWSFSTVGAMESHWNILGKGKNLTFSEQQLVDCAQAFDNHGCNGGLPSHAFEYIKYAGGLQLSSTYPYVGKDQKCKFDKEKVVAYVKTGSFNITQGDQTQLAQSLYSAGPISIAFQVISGFQSYTSGIYSSTRCGTKPQNVNHAVLATGYGVESGKKFWNVKNSWGPTWGMKGYFKMIRDVNMCAVAQCNSYPVIDSASQAQDN